jgi:OFA family oxalate/formate antiporter-like MFS transporter
LANWIVNHFGKMEVVDGIEVNPTGYQAVLYVTLALYIVALLLSVFFVRGAKKEK